MPLSPRPDRRAFLASAAAGLTLAAGFGRAAGPRLKKAVKYGMIKTGSTVLEKFLLIKRLGFQGVEMDSPAEIDRPEVVKARGE